MTVRIILKQLLWAIGLWFLIAAVCFLSGFLRPSYLPYIALAMVYGWYFSIPILFAVVSIISFALHAVRRRKRGHWKDLVKKPLSKQKPVEGWPK